MVVRIRTAVVLPEPFGPSRPKTVPSSTAKLTPSRARTSRLPVKVFFRLVGFDGVGHGVGSCLWGGRRLRRGRDRCRPGGGGPDQRTRRHRAVGPAAASAARWQLTRRRPGGRSARAVAALGSLGPWKKATRSPDFELPDEDGTPRKLSELAADGPVVLFFYPAAMTPGCTAESCHFRDMKAEFDAVGAQRVGISADQVEKQKRFSDKHSFDYPLLSDPDGAVATQFGVRRRFTKLSPTKRATFVIGPDLRVIDVIQSEVRMNVHADRALEALQALLGRLSRRAASAPIPARAAPSPSGRRGDGKLSPWTSRSSTRPAMSPVPGSARIEQLAQAVAERVVTIVMDAIDIDALLERVDVDALISRVDVDDVVSRVDVDGLIDRVDVDKIIERVDVEKIIERVDVKKIIDRVDIDALVEQTELGTIIARSTSGVASEVLDVVRAQGVGLDDFFARWVNRILRRPPQSSRWARRPGGPPPAAPELTAGPQ